MKGHLQKKTIFCGMVLFLFKKSGGNHRYVIC